MSDDRIGGRRDQGTEVDPSLDETLLGEEGEPGSSVELGITDLDERYRIDELLGRGGMGSVHACVDRHIGRRIAIKTLLHTEHRALRDRLVREARIQGQLEHPGILPVYDLGEDETRGAWFTMREIHGVTLEDVLADPEGVGAGWSQRRLVSAFLAVCRAVEFAHQRGVVHRDLKPSNIMLGELGEVYVLDWGIARGERSDVPTAAMTREGSILGTLGYMAPEQALGALDEVGPGSDVYSLGAILFEIVTGVPLHVGDDPQTLLQSTLDGADARPSMRAPELDVAPEVEAVTVKATAMLQRQRHPSVSALVTELDRYLDGSRDEEARRAQAAKLAAGALSGTALALLHRNDPLPRVRALREVGRVLALDPQNPDALSALLQLMREPPDELPPDANESYVSMREARLVSVARSAFFAYMSHWLYVPFLLWVGMRTWWPLFLFVAGFNLAAAAAFYTWRIGGRTDAMVLLTAAFSFAAYAATILFFGPLLFAPALIALNAAMFVLILESWQARAGAVVLALVTYLVGSLLWLADPESGYAMSEATLTIRSGALEMATLPTWVLLVVATAGNLFTGAVSIALLRDAIYRAEQRQQYEMWHLRAMAPAAIADERASVV